MKNEFPLWQILRHSQHKELQAWDKSSLRRNEGIIYSKQDTVFRQHKCMWDDALCALPKLHSLISSLPLFSPFFSRAKDDVSMLSLKNKSIWYMTRCNVKSIGHRNLRPFFSISIIPEDFTRNCWLFMAIRWCVKVRQKLWLGVVQGWIEKGTDRDLVTELGSHQVLRCK